MGTQNFFFVPRSWQDEKTSFLILHRAQNLPSLLLLFKWLLFTVFELKSSFWESVSVTFLDIICWTHCGISEFHRWLWTINSYWHHNIGKVFLLHRLRCYTGISGREKSRNNTREKISYLQTVREHEVKGQNIPGYFHNHLCLVLLMLNRLKEITLFKV